MKLVIDSKFPLYAALPGTVRRNRLSAGADITAANVRDADALIIRTRTHCNEPPCSQGRPCALWQQPPLAMTTSIPTLCTMPTLRGATAPAVDSTSVARFVEAACLLLAAHGCWSETQHHTADCPVNIRHPKRDALCRARHPGRCRMGHVGKSVAKRAAAMGSEQILLCRTLHALNAKGKQPLHRSTSWHAAATSLPFTPL